MIRAIIFDCFGVLVTESWESFCHQHFGNDKDKFAAARELGHQLNQGDINYEVFIQRAAALASITPQAAHDYIDDNKTNLPLLEYIKSDLKPHYKIGMLSNAGDDWLTVLFSLEQLALFDDTVLSFNFGVTKPNPTIYLLAAKRLGIKPQECLFVDDLEKHVDGALNCGMQAIIYRGLEQMQKELKVKLTKK